MFKPTSNNYQYYYLFTILLTNNTSFRFFLYDKGWVIESLVFRSPYIIWLSDVSESPIHLSPSITDHCSLLLYSVVFC